MSGVPSVISTIFSEKLSKTKTLFSLNAKPVGSIESDEMSLTSISPRRSPSLKSIFEIV